MRTTLAVVAILAASGCSETRNARRPAAGMPAATSRAVPVTLEPPSLSSRIREHRQREAERDLAADTTVKGDVVR